MHPSTFFQTLLRWLLPLSFLIITSIIAFFSHVFYATKQALQVTIPIATNTLKVLVAHVNHDLYMYLIRYWDNNLMSQWIKEHTLVTFIISHYRISNCFVLPYTYIHRTLDRWYYKSTMDTIDIMDQGKWQLYIQH